MSGSWCVLNVFVFVAGVVTCRTLFLVEKPPTPEELKFMKTYGYLSEVPYDVGETYTTQSISEAVAKMQKFAGLPQTGHLDPETRSLFKKRRCGVKDIESESAKIRRRRYIIQQGWGRRGISYRVINGSSTLSKSRVEELMAAGLAVWAPHGRLRFQPRDSKADIQVSFTSRDHGDGFPFDGPGRVVAHAFPPPHGSMHFDDDELWGDNPDEDNEDVTDFFAVAVHEIGHALGLSHSNVKASVMYPYYQVPVERLHIDDILGMQELYLKQELPQTPPSSESTESAVVARSSLVPRFTQVTQADGDSAANSDDSAANNDDSREDYDDDDIPDLCFTNYDTIQVIQGKIFVFEEEWMWVLSKRKHIDAGYPRRFHDVFRGLPAYIRVIKTIYEKQNGHIVIFHGRSFWEFSSRFRLIRRGRLSEYRVPPQVGELSTAFLSNYNNKTYLVEYERFWRYDERAAAMDRGYPKDMAAWRLVPYPVDAALVWQGDTFFFRGPRFWRFDNELVRAHEYYPLPTAQIWFPCPETPEMMRYTTNEEI